MALSRLQQKPGFPDTRWSLVLSSHGDDTQAQHAIAEICRTYWYPIYAFARGLDMSPTDAEDITQGFFEKVLGQGVLGKANPAAGKLRSYLIASLRNYVGHMKRRESAKKRGGGLAVLSIDQEEAEGRYLADTSSEESPDRAFERRWAMALLDVAMSHLRHEYVRRGDGATFEILSPLIAETDRGSDYREAAGSLGMKEGAVRVAVFRLRKRYRRIVRDQIGETVSDPAEIDGEIEALFAALVS